MRAKSITASLLLSTFMVLLLVPGMLRAQTIELQDNPPDRYTVQKGDTLWGIAGKFLKQPWRWPDVWRMNRDQIKNPHWIYPGDVIVLDRSGGEPRLSLEQSNGGRGTRLSPQIRVEPLEAAAIPSIPPGDIEPYLTRPLVIDTTALPGAAQFVAARDSRIVRGAGDYLYAVGIDQKAGNLWFIYRPGPALRSFDSGELLGYEMRFLGTANVEHFGAVSTMRIATAREDILVGDLLVPAPREDVINFVPHAPDKAVEGRIILLANDATETGRGYIVTLDRGKQDGLETGNVLAIYHAAPVIEDPRPYEGGTDVISKLVDQTKSVVQPTRYLELPPERTGLLFVFRVFDRVAYAIVLNTTEPIVAGDVVRKP
jgi:hypothetical protein